MSRQTLFQSFARIGLMKWQRRNKPLNASISRECINGVSNKKIAQKVSLERKHRGMPAAPQSQKAAQGTAQLSLSHRAGNR